MHLQGTIFDTIKSPRLNSLQFRARSRVFNNPFKLSALPTPSNQMRPILLNNMLTTFCISIRKAFGSAQNKDRAKQPVILSNFHVIAFPSPILSKLLVTPSKSLYMKVFILLSAILIASISVFFSTPLRDLLNSLTTSFSFNHSRPTNSPIESIQSVKTTSSVSEQSSMSTANTIKNTMSKALSHAKIVPRRSRDRGHADHGWLNTYHTFSFANYYDPRYQNFGSLRVLNEDRVEAGQGFPTHPHRDAEIFSYILNGELTHRDSMIKKGAEGKQSDDFYRMKRGDVQFTTGGTGMFSFLFPDFPF